MTSVSEIVSGTNTLHNWRTASERLSPNVAPSQ